MNKYEKKCPERQYRRITSQKIELCGLLMTKEKHWIKSHLHIKCTAKCNIVAAQDIIISPKTHVYWHFQPLSTMAFIFFLNHCLYYRQQMQRPLGVPLYCLLEETTSIISLNKAVTVGESSSGESFFPLCNFWNAACIILNSCFYYLKFLLDLLQKRAPKRPLRL